MDRALSVYVHIPYCRSKCVYCDFNSYATGEAPWRSLLEGLLTELSLRLEQSHGEERLPSRHLRTLYIGGGTPSLMPADFYATLLPKLFVVFPPEEGLELSIECNPGTLSLCWLEAIRALGVNRISIGLQSLNPIFLKTLTRIHSVEEGLDAVNMARAAGFDNVSVDLMFGVPGQTLEGWSAELERAAQLPLTHLSVYNLTPEEGTGLAALVDSRRLEIPDEEVLGEMYRQTRAILRAHGFEAYEISNFSRQRPCRHNLLYWTGGDYLGLGPGAHSFFGWEGRDVSGSCSTRIHSSKDPHRSGGIRVNLPPPNDPGCFGHRRASLPPPNDPGCFGHRWANLRSPEDYLEALRKGAMPVDFEEELGRGEAAAEFLLTRCRLSEGFDLSALEALVGPVALRAMAVSAEPLVKEGLVTLEEGRLKLEEAGVLLADSIITRLAEAIDRCE